MAKPRFSEYLAQRRRQLNLTVPQAARVLRLKEQVIVAFEEGDWQRIPRSGYALGMLSSYARYLGLNPREVIDMFQDDLDAYTHGHVSPADKTAPYEAGAAPAHGRSRRGQGADIDLYGSAGPAGSILTGTALGHSLRNGSTRRSEAITNGRNAGYSERYLRQYTGDLQNTQEGYPQGRPYTARAPRTNSTRAALPAPRASRQQRSSRAASDARRYAGEGAIQTRRVSQDAYEDDLRYGLASDSYRQATSSEVRQAARSMGSAAQRPNVRRRPSSQAQANLRSRGQSQGSASVGDVIRAWFSDQRRTMATIFVAVAIALIVIIVIGVRSCTADPAPKTSETQQTQTAANSGSDSSADTSTNDTSGAPANDNSADAAAAAAAAAAQKAAEPVVVEVSVPDGAAVWVEVKNGDTNEVAQTVTGPWTKTFNVVSNGQLVVRTADPAQVTVTANGQTVPFNTSAAGVGTATIDGPKVDESASQGMAQSGEGSTSDSGTAAAGNDSSSSAGSGSTASGTGSAGSGSSAASSGTSAGTTN